MSEIKPANEPGSPPEEASNDEAEGRRKAQTLANEINEFLRARNPHLDVAQAALVAILSAIVMTRSRGDQALVMRISNEIATTIATSVLSAPARPEDSVN